ncbi:MULTISPECIES: hypothetical protein [unclassified Ectothiorhodospira]|jgi:hypothetical protein|uniref:hypothetical protein n=1 Tax=unclassified Ectothiorhodospira TaxID=2684909 RepID=UPI001EE9A804|nr:MULTISPECIES: hypothetical protein [unclassified Ectothiorhodospira]MCG5514639.1 hypothetical protein [Ectothiorhodospira sp. 9100]MCG5517987.1 hypothetical protein [Ectothiorhodospira sp. 9905]
MGEGSDIKVLEGLFIIGVVAAFGIWQFISLRRDREERERRKAEKAREHEDQ